MQLGNKILLIEDDKYIALALKIRLQAEGYEVSVVYGCDDARTHVATHVPDIALVDYNLPDGNGIDLVGAFSGNAPTSTITSIIMTASKTPGLRDHALSKGAFGYFEKPFKSTDLIDAIKGIDFEEQRLAC